MSKLETKDLINVGIFSAIYVIVVFLIGMLGYIPILMVTYPIYLPLIAGIPFMLFITKVEKFGMISLMALTCGLIMFLTGHTWLPILTAIIFGVLSDLIIKKGKYKSFKYIAIGYGVFANWFLGPFLPFWLMRDIYIQHIQENMGTEYANSLLSLTPNWLPFVIIIVFFISGVVGAYLGRSVLKKHFQRAGIL